MARRLLVLMRHGKATWPDGVLDHQRPLDPRGFSCVPIMAQWLRGAVPMPDRVLVSSARRTRETFTLLATEWPDLPHEIEPRIYEADLNMLFSVLRAQPERVECLMLVGHNPGMQDLAETLANPEASDADAYQRLTHKFPTSAVAVLEFEGAWPMLRLGDATLRAFQTPRLLGGVDED